MASLRLIFLAGASLLSLDLQRTLGDNTVTDIKGNKALAVSCVSEMNEVRQAAGFSPVEEGAYKFSPDAVYDFKTICEFLSDYQKTSAAEHLNGFMSAPQTGPGPKCSDAVKYWKSAVEDIGQTPPPYNWVRAPYNTLKNLAFFSLFTPQKNSKVRCYFLSCKAADSEKSGGKSDEEKKSAEHVYHLVCSQSPSPLQKGQAPYNSDQWAAITAALRNNEKDPDPRSDDTMNVNGATTGLTSRMSLASIAFAAAVGALSLYM